VEELRFPVKRRAPALRLAKRVFVAWVALTLLVVVASFFVDEPLRRSIERRMNDRLEGYEVRLPKLHFRLFSLSMALDGLVVGQKAHPDPPVLHGERLTTSPSRAIESEKSRKCSFGSRTSY